MQLQNLFGRDLSPRAQLSGRAGHDWLKAARTLGILLLLSFAFPRPAAADPPTLVPFFVKPGGLTSGGCEDWAAACDLQYAMGLATPSPGFAYRIYVEEGTYTPTSGASRYAFFLLRNDTSLYGGYSNTDHSRDPATHVSVLSGDLNGDDGACNGANISDNSYHVVRAGAVDNSALLDGFTITGGNADVTDVSFTAQYGGGLYNDAGGAPRLRNLRFYCNVASESGGGMSNGGPASLLNITFDQNTASNGGGGFFGAGTSLANVTFSQNTAADGAGMYITNGSATITNVTIKWNFAGNSAGGIFIASGASASLTNVILWQDACGSCSGAPDEVLNSPAAPAASSSIDHSVVEGGCPSGSACTNLLTTDPTLGPLANNGGPTPTIALWAGSPAIDAGDGTACSSAPVSGLDQRGVMRPQGPQCDIGAYEHVPVPPFSDFDVDYASDPAKFVPATGYAWWLRSSDATWDGMSMGGNVASYVSRSDFDGDGMTDPAKYVSGSQTLWWFRSSDSTWDGVYMGTGTYTLMPGSDFDGDQMTDPAKYMTDGSYWRLPSSTAVWVGDFIGTDAAPALPGSDYDGDGLTDVAKYVAAGAIWYLKSSDSTWDGAYIGSDGTPVPASDFDGDGITDMTKYLTGSNTLWYLASGTSSWVGVYLGPGSFTYVAASDFDGDGKTDPAKFDTGSQVLWYLKSSTGTWDGVYMGPETYEIVN